MRAQMHFYRADYGTFTGALCFAYRINRPQNGTLLRKHE